MAEGTPGSVYGSSRTPSKQVTGSSNAPAASGKVTIPGLGAEKITSWTGPGANYPVKSRGNLDLSEADGNLSATDLKNLFLKLDATNDPFLKQFMDLYGITDKRVAKAIWDDAATYATNLAKTGQQVDFWEGVLKNQNFVTNYLKIPSSLLGGGGSPAPQAQVQYQKIDTNTARMMLQQAATAQGYGGQITAQMVNEFKNKFNAAAAQSKTIYNPDGTTQYSAFDKDDFTKTWLWSNVSFDDKTARGTAVETLTALKTLARNNGLVRSEAELQATAKWIALGKATLDEVKIKWGQEAVDKYYPMLRDRYAQTPGVTVRDLMSPWLSTISSELEIPESDIGFDDPLILRALGKGGGVDGKDTSMSLYDLKLAAMDDPRWEKTSKANTYARDAATELARAWGFGI